MPTTPVTGTFTPTTPGVKPREQTDIFSSGGFLKLLASQMRNQNPLEPVKDMEFIGQMAQFSTLEQVTNLNTTNQLAQRAGLIGKQVTYQRANGLSSTGTVERLVIDNVAQTVRLVVNGVEIDPSTVLTVENPA